MFATRSAAKKPPIQRWLDEVMSAYSRWILFSAVAVFAGLALLPRVGPRQGLGARRVLPLLPSAHLQRLLLNRRAARLARGHAAVGALARRAAALRAAAARVRRW